MARRRSAVLLGLLLGGLLVAGERPALAQSQRSRSRQPQSQQSRQGQQRSPRSSASAPAAVPTRAPRSPLVAASGGPRRESTRRVRLLVIESSPEFSSRVRGQVSDLELTLELDAAAAPSTRAELEALMVVRAARHDADVVAWLGELSSEGGPGARGASVYVWIVGHESVHARRVGPRPSLPRAERPRGDGSVLSLAAGAATTPDERSATLEAAALVVRSAVRAVSFEREGGASGESEANHSEPSSETSEPTLQAPEPRATPEPAATPESGAPPASPARTPEPASAVETRPRAALLDADRGAGESSGRERRAVRWSPRAGLDWSHAGLSRAGFWSASAGLDLHWGALSGGASASWGFAEPVAYRGVALELDRRALLAELGWALLDGENFGLRPKLGAGAAWLTRRTQATAWGSGLEPAQTSLSALVTGELVAEYRLAGPFTLDLHGGVRWFSHTTHYLVESPLGDVPLAAGWRWQPNAGVALGAVF